MVTAKPKRGYVSRPFSLYHPTDAEVTILVETIEGYTTGKLGTEFAETIRRLLILLRKQMDIQQNAPRKGAQYVELIQLRNALRALDGILSREGMSEPLFHSFEMLKIKHQLSDQNDPIYGVRVHMHNLLQLCSELERGFIDDESSKLTLSQFRDIVAEELARALDKAGCKPTATRGGAFEKAFEAFVEHAACTIERRTLRMAALKEPYAVIRRAVKNYHGKPPYPLLGMDSLFKR